MMLGHMGEKHTDGIPVQFMILSAHECYKFVFEGLVDLEILHSQMWIRKCNIFKIALNIGAGLNLNEI